MLNDDREILARRHVNFQNPPDIARCCVALVSECGFRGGVGRFFGGSRAHFMCGGG